MLSDVLQADGNNKNDTLQISYETTGACVTSKLYEDKVIHCK